MRIGNYTTHLELGIQCDLPSKFVIASEQFSFSAPTMSHHFSVLRDAGLVRSEISGQKVVYSLNTTVLQELLSTLLDTFGVEGRPE